MTPSDYKVTVWWTVLMVGLACATGFGVGVLTANVGWAFLSAVCSVVLLEAVTTLAEHVTLWQLRHPRKAWWMAHTGQSLVAEYEQEYPAGTFRVGDWVCLNPAVAPDPIQQLLETSPSPRRVIHVERAWVDVLVSPGAVLVRVSRHLQPFGDPMTRIRRRLRQRWEVRMARWRAVPAAKGLPPPLPRWMHEPLIETGRHRRLGAPMHTRQEAERDDPTTTGPTCPLREDLRGPRQGPLWRDCDQGGGSQGRLA